MPFKIVVFIVATVYLIGDGLGQLPLPQQEDALLGHSHFVEHHQRLHVPALGPGRRKGEIVLVPEARAADLRHARGVHGNREGDGIVGELGVTKRDDGTFQVAYDGMPLYFWVNDEAPGDTTGHEVNDVWFIVAP